MTDALKNAIAVSGNNLHSKVIKFFKDENWDMEISAYYLDDTTTKPREIDIIAKKKIGIAKNAHPKDFWVSLFVECKHFTEEFAFWTYENESKVKLPKFTGNIRKEFVADDHHYFSSLIGKLYTCAGKDEVFDAIIQPVKALVSFRDLRPLSGFYYPICVYEGISGIYSILSDQDLKDLDQLSPQKNILAEVNYSWRKIENRSFPTALQEYFAVDMTHFDDMKKLLIQINSEAEKTKSKILDSIKEEDRSFRSMEQNRNNFAV